MGSARMPAENECRIAGCLWTFGKYGIKQNGGKNWYVWWYNNEKGENDRYSLRTPIFSLAIQRATDMINGIDPRYPGGDPIVYDIIKEHVESHPKGHHRYKIWNMLEPTLKELTCDLKVSRLGMMEVQHEIIKHIISRGYVSSTTHQLMAGISSAITWAATTECAPGVKRSKHHPKIIMKENVICKTFGIPKQKVDNWHPDREGMVRLINALQGHPAVLRWLLVMLTFGCRVEAAAEATGEQLTWSQYKLNPDGRPEYENKRRPELPVAWSSLAEFRTWGDGPWIGLTAKQIHAVFSKVREKLDLPKLKPSSIRDYATTMLRHAHVTHGVRYVPEEQAKLWQGHMKVDDVHQNYGEFRPEYHIRCRVATEAALRDLDLRSGGAFFRQGSDKTPLRELAATEEVEDISGFLGVNASTELPRETTIYMGPEQDKTGEIGPVQGAFRQVSDKKVRHPDGTIDALGTYKRPSLEERLIAQGVEIVERDPRGSEATGNEVFLYFHGLHQIPACRAGDLKRSSSIPKNINILNEHYIPVDTSDELITALRKFELEMTDAFGKCKSEDELESLDITFEMRLPCVVGPVLIGFPKIERSFPDLDSMTDDEREEWCTQRLAEIRSEAA